jgi:hypothetical protein
MVVEQQPKSTQGFVSMWKSKLKAADEQEKFLLYEMKRASEPRCCK